ncbi:MAG: hypothetical protein ACXVAX_06350 [Pseudobdellovibrio sp.]
MKNLLLFFILGLMSYSTNVLGQETEENEEAPVATNRPNQGPVSNAPHEEKDNSIVNLDGSESSGTAAPVSFDLSNLKPSGALSPESVQKIKTQLSGFTVSDFSSLPPNFRSFVIQRADSPEDRRFLESLHHDDVDDAKYGPHLTFKESKPFQDLVDAYNNRPLKFKIKKIKGMHDLSGQKIKGSGGWGFEISVPLGK